MPLKPLVIGGHVYQQDGSTAQEGAVVFVYNKDKDETKNGYDPDFPELVTNSAGEYLINLANWNYTDEDEIFITAFYGDKAQMLNFTIDANVGAYTDKDLTLRDYEPAIAVSKLIRMKLADPNTDNRVSGENWVRPKYGKRDMTKDRYPVITVRDIDENSESARFPADKLETRTSTVEITIHVWAHSGNTQSFTISGSKYEGSKLRDYLARQVSEILRKEFYLKPAYDRNAIIHRFHDYNKIGMESLPFDEEADLGIMTKEIIITLTSDTTEV